MRKRIRTLIFAMVCSVALLTGCGKDTTETPATTEVSETEATQTKSIEITSADLHDGVWDTVITKTKNGSNVSPQLSWEAVDGASSYVIYMVDNTAAGWLHWISNDVTGTELPQGWAGENEYVGPYPPGGTHEYEIYVIALKEPVSEVFGKLDNSNATFYENRYRCDMTDEGEAGNILAIGTLAGTYTAGE